MAVLMHISLKNSLSGLIPRVFVVHSDFFTGYLSPDFNLFAPSCGTLYNLIMQKI